jgi:squalene-hopene/tetraprenyl-beta-curcumene cyclase
MKTALSLFVLLILAPATQAQRDISFMNELQRSIDRGITSLKASQNPDGWWTSPEHPAVTALALIAWQGNPNKPKQTPKWIQKGYDFLLTHVQPDGSIYVPGKGLANYNTSLCMMALLAANDKKHNPTLLKARAYLAKQQWDLGEKGKQDHPLDGGVGYGGRYPHSDLNNTLSSLEALYFTRHLVKDAPPQADLNWKAAIGFIQNCQNLPSHNKQPWASNDPKQKGGMIYFPGKSMAGTVKDKNGKTALRSYGSISYAGMMSYAYARLKADDPRVVAVRKWIFDNFTLEENPAMGAQGLYYYYYLMAKALSFSGDRIITVKGKKIDWRKALGLKLIGLQQQDGSWVNSKSARWWESEKPLVTAYSVIALSYIYRGE